MNVGVHVHHCFATDRRDAAFLRGARLHACRYCYALGYAAGALISHSQTGLMATIGDLHKPTAEWCGTASSQSEGLSLAYMFNKRSICLLL